MGTKYAVIVFPGTWSETDWRHAINGVAGAAADLVFHKQEALSGYDCIVLPGGFSYGDYLRPGAIARFSPVMNAISRFAREGGPVIGSCNGFQVLCESGLLPGALLRNRGLKFRCKPQHLLVERATSPFTSRLRTGQVISIPVSHGDGNYFADQHTLDLMESRGQIMLRYCDEFGSQTDLSNPNGSARNIAGITNEMGNVLGMMPHPERVVEEEMGGTDGLLIIESIQEALRPSVNSHR